MVQVSQQLKVATVAVGELEGVQEHCDELEAEVTQARGQLNQKDTELRELELVSVCVCTHVCIL